MARPGPPDPDPSVRRLFEPLDIGGFTVRNRIVNPTHGTGLDEEREVRYLRERARGGAALLGVQASHGVRDYAIGTGPRRTVPGWDERSLHPLTPDGISHFDGRVIPPLRRRAEVIHAEGSHCYAQVYHPGAARHWRSVDPTMAPSAVPDPYEAHIPHILQEDQIGELAVVFAHGIRRIQQAGMDAAEIHGAHGYLVNQFLSPYFNRRTDAWGGSVETRARFPLAIINEARSLVGPDYPIGIRLGIDGDGRDRGMTLDDLVGTCRLLAPHVAYLSISGGSYAGYGGEHDTAYVSPWYRPPGMNVFAAAAVRGAVDVPVIVTGRNVDPALAEGILADGSADMVGMVRALIADPALPHKARTGRSADIRSCLGLSECHAVGPHRVPLTCAVNAAAAREKELELRPVDRRRTVVVVGAGPAGMEAARVAAERGHHVYLADARRSIGGTPAVLALDENRHNLHDQAAYFDVQLRRLGVERVLGNEVSAQELVGMDPYAVVVATGSIPVRPHITGIEAPDVVDCLEVLAGAATREHVVVVGGLEKHLGPPTIAEFLADQGKTVELLSEHLDFAQGVEDATRLELMRRLTAKGVRVSMLHRLEAVGDGEVVVREVLSNRRRRIEQTSVVLACGRAPNNSLADSLRGHVERVIVVGDALAPRRIMHATLDGARAALSL